MHKAQQKHHHPHVAAIEQQGVKERMKAGQRANGEGEVQQDVRRTAISANRHPICFQGNIGL